MKNIVVQIKTSLDGLISSLDLAEERTDVIAERSKHFSRH